MGPSQICGCLFREPRVFTIAHMHNSFCRQTVFTQKVLRTEVLRKEGFTHNIFYIQMLLHTDVFAQTQIAHRNLCTQHAFTHTANFYTERLCFLFLITYLSCSPSQVCSKERRLSSLVLLCVCVSVAPEKVGCGSGASPWWTWDTWAKRQSSCCSYWGSYGPAEHVTLATIARSWGPCQLGTGAVEVLPVPFSIWRFPKIGVPPNHPF